MSLNQDEKKTGFPARQGVAVASPIGVGNDRKKKQTIDFSRAFEMTGWEKADI